MPRKTVVPLTLVLISAIIIIGCTTQIPQEALTLSPESIANRQLQTRLFDTRDEKKILTASAQLLQDLGYTLNESETACGVIVCSRERDITDAGEVVGSIAFAMLFGVYLPVNQSQKVIASLVTRPLGDRIAVRITFQQIIWDTDNNLRKNEQINDPEVYQEFFEKLSKSIFLTAHEI